MRYGTPYGFFELNPFPGCNQLVISNHSWIHPKHRGQGIGSEEHLNRLGEIERLGYDCAICTVKSDNIAQIKILEKFGWTYCYKFNNRETGNEVLIYARSMS